MPRNANVSITPNGAAALSDGAVNVCRVQNASGYPVTLQATLANTAPTSRSGGVTLPAGATLAADLPLAALFPGIGSGALFLWGFSDLTGDVSVSHE